MAEHGLVESLLSPSTKEQFRQAGSNVVTVWDTATSKVWMYVVYSDSGGLKMARSSDEGKTYVESTITSTTGLIGQSVWYDRWSPGDNTGNLIHIAVADPATEKALYFSWNAVTNSAGSITNKTVFTYSSITGSLGTPDGGTSICKSGGGSNTLYVMCKGNLIGVSGQGRVHQSLDNGLNWSDITNISANPPSTYILSVDDIGLLVPYGTGNGIMVIHGNNASTLLRYQTFNDLTNTWSAVATIDTNYTNNTDLEQSPCLFNVTLDKTTGDVYLVNISHVSYGTGAPIYFRKYTASTGQWSIPTHLNATLPVAGDNLHETNGCAIERDQTNGMLTVYYTKGNSINNYILIRHSSDDGRTWSDAKQLKTNIANHYYSYISCPLVMSNINEGWYACFVQNLSESVLYVIDHNSAVTTTVESSLPYIIVSGNVKDMNNLNVSDAEVAMFKVNQDIRACGGQSGLWSYEGSARTNSDGNYKCLVMSWPEADNKYQGIVQYDPVRQQNWPLNIQEASLTINVLGASKFYNLPPGKKIKSVKFYSHDNWVSLTVRMKAFNEVAGEPLNLLGESNSTVTQGSVRQVDFITPVTIPDNGIVWIGLESSATSNLILAGTGAIPGIPTGFFKTMTHTYGTGPDTWTTATNASSSWIAELVGDSLKVDATIGELKD